MKAADLLSRLALRPAPVLGETPQELVFDDEPLEAVLYGEAARGPSPANLHAPARELLARLGADPTKVSESTLQTILRFLDEGHPVSDALFRSLVQVAAALLPRWPRPASPDLPL